MSGYDSVNRNVSSRVRKVARDGADVTSSGRVPDPRVATEKCSVVNSGAVNWRLDEAVYAENCDYRISQLLNFASFSALLSPFPSSSNHYISTAALPCRQRSTNTGYNDDNTK